MITLPLTALKSPFAILALLLFCIAYIFVILEESLNLKKSKPVVAAATLIWALTAYLAQQQGMEEAFKQSLNHCFLDYSEILLFLVVAMTYIHVMEDCYIFDALSGYLVNLGLSLRQVFWLTGFLAFLISPLADNLTTALLMGSVVLAIAPKEPRFIGLACINIVVAANAGGAFSPFGDITTLMVWQKGKVSFGEFFNLVLPALCNFLIPAFCMHSALPKTKPQARTRKIILKPGSKRVIGLFVATLATSIILHHCLALPPVLGMMLGLSYLQFLNYFLKSQGQGSWNVFQAMQKCDWDTLLYFYGVILCIGALGTLGYLQYLSNHLYSLETGLFGLFKVHTEANILLGLFSAILDNIPLMFALLTMSPEMSTGQWLLATLTAGVGGSLLSLGSAAGVALMGLAPQHYTFKSHLKWSWAILLGYGASIWLHCWWNSNLC